LEAVLNLTLEKADEIRGDVSSLVDCVYATVRQGRGDSTNELVAKASETILLCLMSIARREDDMSETADDLASAALIIRNEILNNRYSQKQY
jgi:hypothetical protein